jgi:hypothetical protein
MTRASRIGPRAGSAAASDRGEQAETKSAPHKRGGTAPGPPHCFVHDNSAIAYPVRWPQPGFGGLRPDHPAGILALWQDRVPMRFWQTMTTRFAEAPRPVRIASLVFLALGLIAVVALLVFGRDAVVTFTENFCPHHRNFCPARRVGRIADWAWPSLDNEPNIEGSLGRSESASELVRDGLATASAKRVRAAKQMLEVAPGADHRRGPADAGARGQ